MQEFKVTIVEDDTHYTLPAFSAEHAAELAVAQHVEATACAPDEQTAVRVAVVSSSSPPPPVELSVRAEARWVFCAEPTAPTSAAQLNLPLNTGVQAAPWCGRQEAWPADGNIDLTIPTATS